VLYQSTSTFQCCIRIILNRYSTKCLFLAVTLYRFPQKCCAQDSWLNRYYSVQTANKSFFSHVSLKQANLFLCSHLTSRWILPYKDLVWLAWQLLAMIWRPFRSLTSRHSSIKTFEQCVVYWRSRELLFTSSRNNTEGSQIIPISILQQQERSPIAIKDWWTSCSLIGLLKDLLILGMWLIGLNLIP